MIVRACRGMSSSRRDSRIPLEDLGRDLEGLGALRDFMISLNKGGREEHLLEIFLKSLKSSLGDKGKRGREDSRQLRRRERIYY